MICSLAELGLEKESGGIHRFELKILRLVVTSALLGLDDVILDFRQTGQTRSAWWALPRSCCNTGAPLKLPLPQSRFPQRNEDSDKISETQACPAYIGTVIEQVKVGPSQSGCSDDSSQQVLDRLITW